MTEIKNEIEFKVAVAKIEELLPLTWGDDVPENSPAKIELMLLSELVADYEDKYIHIEPQSHHK